VSTPSAPPTAAPRTLRDVVFVEGVRTPFGKAGEKGQYAQTRADDMVVKVIRELLRRQPGLPPERIDEVAIAAATQTGDQGLTIGRSAAILAGLPRSVPGFAIDRMCAGAMTAVTTVASGIAVGAYDAAIAGGVEHMGHHPMGEGADPNPRFVSDRLVDPSALMMGSTAENLHDRYPHLTKQRADEYALASQEKYAKALANGKIEPDLVPVATRSVEQGWGLAVDDEMPRPGTTLEGLGTLRTPFRPHGRVTAGNASGLTDGATGCLLVAADLAEELGLPVRMRMVAFAFAGVDPETMGTGPIPSTEKALAKAGLTIDDIDLIEINEAFAVQVLAFTDHFGLADDDEKVNQYGGAIAMGHPLASSGVRLMTQLARQFEERPDVHYGLTTMCVGLGMGGTVIWENPHFTAQSTDDTATTRSAL
jgi:acetyl-CoA acyltransferase